MPIPEKNICKEPDENSVVLVLSLKLVNPGLTARSGFFKDYIVERKSALFLKFEEENKESLCKNCFLFRIIYYMLVVWSPMPSGI